MTKFYRKEIPEMPVYINGAPLRFEVLATQDAGLIRELDNAIAGQRGGVVAITEDEFNEAQKKKPSGISSESVFKQNRQRQELSAPHLGNLAAGEARVGGMFAQRQDVGRPHTPHNQTGLRSSASGPAGNKASPDPIQVPDKARLVSPKPPTAKLGALSGA